MALHSRFSIPCATLVAALVSTPLGIMFAKGGPYIGAALSIIIVFLYYTAMQTTRALGEAGYLVPFLAAWLPNLVFGGMGLGLLTRVERI